MDSERIKMEIKDILPQNSNKSYKLNKRNQTIYRFFAVVYSVFILFSALLNWEVVLPYLQNNFGINPSNFFLLKASFFLNDTLSQIYPGLLKISLIFFVIISLWASLGISRGRSILESLALYMSYLIPKPMSLWGKVISKATRSEVPFASIKIISQNIRSGERKFESESISDLFGRYRVSFDTEEGKTYFLTCKNEKFKFFEEELSVEPNEHITIYKDLELVPLDNKISFRQELVNKIFYPSSDLSISALFIVSILSAIVTGWAVINNLTIGSFVYFSLMIISLFWNTYILIDFQSRKTGRLIFVEDNKPAEGITLSLSKKGNRVATSKTNKDGTVIFSIDPGFYELSLMGNNNCEFVDNRSYLEVEINKKGSIKNNVFVKKIISTSTSNIINPFS